MRCTDIRCSKVVSQSSIVPLMGAHAGAFFVPAYPLEEVLDPTGAGDSFAGGLMGYLASRGEVSPVVIRKAMYFASALGSFCVEGIGPSRLLAVKRTDLATRMASFARLVEHGGDLTLPA